MLKLRACLEHGDDTRQAQEEEEREMTLQTVGAIERDIQEREHELYPDEKLKHTNCRACGPGPLKRGLVPSAFPPVFYKVKLGYDDYGSYSVRAECDAKDATIVSSELDDRRGVHTPALDIDIPARLVESSTPGHSHLYIDIPLTWRQYKRLLRAMMKAGIIEKEFYKASVARKATHLRPPWTEKETV